MNVAEAIAATKAARESHPVEPVDLDTHQDASPAAGAHVSGVIRADIAALPTRPLDGVTKSGEFLRGSPLEYAHLSANMPLAKQEWTTRQSLSLRLGRVTRAEIVDHDGTGYPP